MKNKPMQFLKLMLTVCILFNFHSSYAQIPTNGLVAYYPFNGNANNQVSNTINGNVVGATLTSGRTANNMCYNFDGINDRILIPSNFDNLPRTINLWFNAASVSYSDWRFIYESDNQNLQYGLLELVLRQHNGQLKLFINAGNCRDTVDINTNTWYNANLYVDSTKRMKFHLNGVLESNKTFTTYSKSGSGSANVVIGADRLENQRLFAGKIDDIAVYNRELSQLEIDSIYNSIQPPPPPPAPLDSLVAFYPFDGNTNDISGNNLNGTAANVSNAPNRGNVPSTSYKFNGINSYVEFPSNFDFVPRTVNLWFKAEQDDYSDWKFIYESDNPALVNGLMELVLRQEMGQLLLYINAGNCRDTVNVQINTWYNANFYVDSNKVMKFYLNGVLVSNKTFTNFLTSGDGINKVILGTDRHKLSRYFKGQIDDVRFFSYELSQTEINSIYTSILPPPPPPPPVLDSLVAFYPFDGNTNDTSGNNLHGMANNIQNAANRFNNPNSSYKFNGINSYVEFPSNFDFLPRTVNLWFKADQDDYSDWKFIYESDNPALVNGLLELVLREEMGQLLLYINAGSARDTVDVQINTWYNASLYVDSNKIMKFYLNGKLVSNKSFTNFLTSGGGINKVILGTDRFKLSRYFKGQIDDVRYYSYELSPTEINNIVNEGLNVCHVTVTDTLIINVNLFNSAPVAFNNTLKIYPNPTKDKINIDCGPNYLSMQNSSVRITNSLGQAMFDTKISQQYFEVDMSTWSGKGLYLVYIIDSKGNITDVRKIVLQ